MLKKAAISSLLLFTGFFSMAQSSSDSLMFKKISDEIFMNGQAYSNLRFLCKKVGSRLSGSAGAAKAVEETARMLREAGADTVYLQPCMVPQWVRGAKEVGKATLTDGKTMPLNIVSLGNAVGTPVAGINAKVVEVKNFAELEKLGAEKVNRNEPSSGTSFSAKSEYVTV